MDLPGLHGWLEAEIHPGLLTSDLALTVKGGRTMKLEWRDFVCVGGGAANSY